MILPKRRFLFIFAAFAAFAHGQSIWDGGADTSLWNDANNWSADTLPTSGSAVQFTGTSPYAINLNGNRTAASLLFSGSSGYTLSGGTLTLSGGITTSSPASGSVTHAISSALSLAAPTINLAASTRLALSGTVAASGAVTKNGSGTLILAGDVTFSGSVTVSAGTLQIGNGGSAGTLAFSSVANLGTGGTLRLTIGNFVTSGPFAIKNGATFISTGQALTATVSDTKISVDGGTYSSYAGTFSVATVAQSAAFGSGTANGYVT